MERRKTTIFVRSGRSFLTYLILGVIIGGRLGYVIFTILNTTLNLSVSSNLGWWDGFSRWVHWCRHRRYFFSLANSLLWSTSDHCNCNATGLLFGRIANVELWGRPTEAPWGVYSLVSLLKSEAVVGPCARHPSQLYGWLEGLLLFVIFFILLSKVDLGNLAFWMNFCFKEYLDFSWVFSSSRRTIFSPTTHMDLLTNLAILVLRWVNRCRFHDSCRSGSLCKFYSSF